MNVLFILNDAPVETGRSINGLRLACALSMRSSMYVRVFLLGESIACARKPEAVRAPSGDTAALVTAVIRHGGDVRVCEMCEEERNERCGELVDGAMAASLDELAHWIPEADRLLVF